jgi:uncharacterized protein
MVPWLEVSIFGLTIFFMLVGMVGLIVPIYPGLVVMWLATLGYGIVTGFATRGILLFGLITVLMIAGSLVDNLLMGSAARKGGASWKSILAGFLAGIIGTLALPPIGGILAAPCVILILEFLRSRDWKKAWLATRGLAIGWGISYFIRLGIGVFILGLWLIWALWK